MTPVYQPGTIGWEMPIFEFRCRECGKKFEALLGANDDPAAEPCPVCGAKGCAKLVSRFRRMRSENDRIDAIADQLESMDEPQSASEMREYVKEMGRATDDDMSGELEEMFEADLEGAMGDE